MKIKKSIDNFNYEKARDIKNKKFIYLDTIAAEIEISRVYLCKILCGERKPSIEQVKLLAKMLCVKYKDLIKK